MFKHEKRLFHPVAVERPDPQYAALLQEQLGGANGELKAAMQYMSQSFRVKDPEIKDLFLDIAAEELGHMEMIAQTINLLNGHDVDAQSVPAGQIQSHVLLGLAQIPAPSNHEEKRAAFCKAWLEQKGAEGVYIDEALNVIYPVGCGVDTPLVVFMAHSDVVFPDTDPLPLVVENGRINCPGVGDDTANVVALLMTAAYIAENHLQPRDHGVLLVVNSGEEGLGNLKGTRKIMEIFGSRIKEFVSFDGTCGFCVSRAVGSKRYRIEFDTEGGHSYGAFGNRNAIACMASMIDALYSIKVPEKGKTTYNVGTISGGTSVNTIAQHAEMLYEFRSDERESLAIMKRHLEAAVEFYRAKGIKVTVTLMGDRPCSGDVDPEKMEELMARASTVIGKYYGREVRFGVGSTDCNIPLSMGIPAICHGCYVGGGAHTREEYVEIDSLLPGLKVAFEQVLYYF